MFFCQKMLDKKTVCLRQLGETRAGEMRIGRWLSNDKVSVDEIKKTITSKTQQHVIGKHILGIQDTTEINYQHHAERTTGLGIVGNGKDKGFFLHPMLMLDAVEGTCLGLGPIKLWNRTKTAELNYRMQPIEEKESYRWLEVGQAAKDRFAQADMLTIIADRESDIYEEWSRLPDKKTHLITRACRDRKLITGCLLSEFIKNSPVNGCYKFAVPGRPGKRTAHEARLEIRYGEVAIQKTKTCRDKNAPKSISLRVVDVSELSESVVGNEAPIHWKLLTTHAIDSVEDALQIVRWYIMRWNIEQLFRTLKRQGLDIESSQVETGEGLMKLSVIALYIACQILQLSLARHKTEQDIRVVFTAQECAVLLVLLGRLEGKTEKQKNPYSPNKLSWASWIIARLGGWKGYASESPPGPITMFKGLKYFRSLFEGIMLAKDVCID
jgi:hypothetical protein